MKKHIMVTLIALALAISPAAAIEDPVFEQPVLITSAGQSAEVQIASVLAKRAGIAATLDKLASAAVLQKDPPKTIILVLGVSMKGLGAAGLDTEEEKSRISALVKEASKQSIPILSLHLGGEARRGELSDALIEEYIPISSAVLFVKSGNSDFLLSSICQKHSIPWYEVGRAAEALAPLKKLFGLD